METIINYLRCDVKNFDTLGIEVAWITIVVKLIGQIKTNEADTDHKLSRSVTVNK